MLFAKPFGGRFHRRPSTSTLVAALHRRFGRRGDGGGKLTYLLPAPPSLPAFAPWVLAKHLGYYAEAGYDVDFVVARGGVDVAKQIGGQRADRRRDRRYPIIVRGNGVPVKSVGLMGGGALTVVVGRKDRGIEKLEDLRGKKISVLAFQDTTYYALLGALASRSITKNDVNAQAVGPAAVASLVVAGTVDAAPARRTGRSTSRKASERYRFPPRTISSRCRRRSWPRTRPSPSGRTWCAGSSRPRSRACNSS